MNLLRRAINSLSGLTIAEYFRDGDGDGKGKDVLFFVDNIFRFTQAGSEVSAAIRKNKLLTCRIPTYAVLQRWVLYKKE